MGVIGADPRNDFLQGDFGHYYWVWGLLPPLSPRLLPLLPSLPRR
jgi:hypothetical protein